MKAKLTSLINGESVIVTATTEHSASSYGIPVWVDDDGNAYCQVGLEGFWEVEYLDDDDDDDEE